MLKSKNRIWVAPISHLKDGEYKRIEVSYAGQPSSVIVFRMNGECLAYRNLCVHMPRQLDCLKDMIFDEAGKHLRCSMHGIVFNPQTGESVSTICHGEKLTPVRLQQDNNDIWIADKRVKPLPSGNDDRPR